MSCSANQQSQYRYKTDRYSTGAPFASQFAHTVGHAVQPFGYDYSRCEADETRCEIIHFNTEDRDTADLKDPSNCVIKFPGVNNCKRAKITQAEIHHNQYIINEYNNVLVYTELTAPGPLATETFTIPPGNYTGTTLATAIQADFDSKIGGGVVTVVFSTSKNTFTFTRTDAPGNTLNFPFLTNPLNISNPANEAIGLSLLRNYTATAGGATIVSDSCVSLSGPLYLLLQVKELAQDSTSDYNFNVFAKIQCRTAPDSNLFYNCNQDCGSSGKYFASMPQKIGQLSVRLVNPDGRPYLGRGCNYSFSVQFETCGG